MAHECKAREPDPSVCLTSATEDCATEFSHHPVDGGDDLGVQTLAGRSAIYSGVLTHRRLYPFRRVFQQRLFMLYIDLAELPGLFLSSRFWSLGRFGLIRFARSDYYGNPQQPLDDSIRDLVKQKTGVAVSGPVRLLAHPRCMGFCFNPIAIYYCFDESGDVLKAIVAEVTNTPWGDRHQYVMPIVDTDAGCEGVPSAGPHANRQHEFNFKKSLHVSPFYPMDMAYLWRCNEPGAKRLFVHIDLKRNGVSQFDATLALNYQEPTGSNLDRALLRFPAMAFQGVVNIYWQALKLWLSGARYHSKPKQHSSV